MGLKNYLPDWINRKYEERKQNEQANKRDEITDFPDLIQDIWCMSNEDYQERIWVNHETLDIVDSFDDTTMDFSEMAQAVLGASDAGRVEMTDQQYKMLKKLYNLIENYNGEPNIPFIYYGRVDALIVKDKEWHKIRDYARLVYEELIKKRG